MNDNQILSTFQELTPAVPAAQPAPVLVFDACHIGVVLRAVLFVELSLSVVCMFAAAGLWDWIARLALVTGAALPGTLAWLLSACIAKRWLARMPKSAQYALAISLGGVAGLYGCGLLALSGLLESPPLGVQFLFRRLVVQPVGRSVGHARQRPHSRRYRGPSRGAAIAHPAAFFVQYSQ